MQRRLTRSPTPILLLGLLLTLAAVVAYSWYVFSQVNALKRLQTDLVERNRKASLQLLRIQNDLNGLGLAMRDMLDRENEYPIHAWAAQFERIRTDLDDALSKEQEVAVAHRSPEQRAYLARSIKQFWDAADRVFSTARAGDEKEARAQVQLSLQARQQALSTAVSRLLVQNNEAEQEAAQQIAGTYERVQRQVYWFLAVTLVAITFTGLYSIYSNRRLFANLQTVSEQRSELAQTLIGMQESTLRHISRELHDEFGQILTAIGLLVRRAEKQSPETLELRAELHEVSGMAQGALDKVRSLSQALHPVTLEEAGLESTMDWYLPTFQRQTGVQVEYEKTGEPFELDKLASVHIYRVLQEALNNVVRHAKTDHARVQLRFADEALELRVEDNGIGMQQAAQKGPRAGIGMVAMRERAELIGGEVRIGRNDRSGTVVSLSVPRTRCETKDA